MTCAYHHPYVHMQPFEFIDCACKREEEGERRALSGLLVLLDAFFCTLLRTPCFARPYPLFHGSCKVASPTFSLHISPYIGAGVPRGATGKDEGRAIGFIGQSPHRTAFRGSIGASNETTTPSLS